MPNKPKSLADFNCRETGFSLIELMVSLAVFIIFLTSLYGLLRIGNIQKNTVNSQTEVMKNLRLSLNTIGRDAVNAGLGYSRVGGNMPDNLTNLRLGLPSDSNTTQDLLTAVVAGNNINTNVFLTNPNKTDVIAFAYQDKNFNADVSVPFTDSAVLGTTGVTLTSPNNGAINVKPYDLLFISEGSTGRTAMALVTSKSNDSTLNFEIGSADPLGINSPFNGTPDSKSRLTKCNAAASPPETTCMNFATITGKPSVVAKKVFWISYSVTNEGVLMRTTYGNNTNATAAQQIQAQPIAYDIQNLQIRYLLRDGTLTDDPSVNGTIQGALNNVVQIQITLTAKVAVQENGTTIQKVVDLKSTFSTVNLLYDAS